MTPEEIKATLAPCGLCCATCFAHVDGDIRNCAVKLKEKLGHFQPAAQRFVTLLDEPIFTKYPDFAAMLDYLAASNCRGCRQEQCKLFKGCGVRACHQEKQVDFCHQCEQFPCDRTGFDAALYARWVSLNETIRKVGLEPFANKALERPRYP